MVAYFFRSRTRYGSSARSTYFLRSRTRYGSSARSKLIISARCSMYSGPIKGSCSCPEGPCTSYDQIRRFSRHWGEIGGIGSRDGKLGDKESIHSESTILLIVIDVLTCFSRTHPLCELPQLHLPVLPEPDPPAVQIPATARSSRRRGVSMLFYPFGG